MEENLAGLLNNCNLIQQQQTVVTPVKTLQTKI
jgi:hypothetical protein